MLRPFIMAEVRVYHAQADDQVVVVHDLSTLQVNAPFFHFNSAHLSHDHRDVVPLLQNGSHGLRHVRHGETGRRHLIKQGLEQMVILPLDDGHLSLRMPKLLSKSQAAKPSTQHNNTHFHL